MPSGNDILSYQGNAAMGLAQTGGLSEYGERDLTPANNALFNLAYLNLQKNKAVYDQKIKERDDGMRLMAEGAMQLTNALPQDREKLMQLYDGIKHLYFEKHGDVKSDPNVWLDLNDRLARFREATALAGSRWNTYQAGVAEAAKETDPNKKQAMLNHWQGQLQKDIYQPFDPYQQTLDWDPAIIQRPMAAITKEIGPDKSNKFHILKETRTDVGNAYRDYVNEYMYGGKGGVANNVNEFMKNFYGQNNLLHPDEVQGRVDFYNQQLQDIARKEGYDPANIDALPAYLKPIQLVRQNGQLQSTDTVWNDWFKTQLVDQYRRVQNSELDKNQMNLWELEQKNQIERTKANAAAAKDYADARLSKEKARQMAEKTDASEDNFISDTESAFSRAYDSLTKHKTNSFTIDVKALSDQDKIGLGVTDEDKRVTYNKNGTFQIGSRTVTPADYYRNSLKEYYSKKIKQEDGTIDNEKLEYNIDRAITKGLKSRGYDDPEGMNYIRGGLQAQRFNLPGTNKFFVKKGARFYDEETGKDITKYVQKNFDF
jgi:hypothetical protein